jgi:hypothetical protein
VSFGAQLSSELANYFPPDDTGPFPPGDLQLSPLVVADRAIRALAPEALEVSGASAAAARIRALPVLTGAEAARSTMPALERIARGTGARPDLIRSASQIAGAVIRLESPGGEEQGTSQLVAAIVRLVLASVRAGLPLPEALSALARAD